MAVAASTDEREFVHYVDAQNRIVLINQDWVDFAVENDVAHLTEVFIKKEPIWKYISGMETRFVFEVMLAKVRRKEGPVEVPFRCDAPNRRRFMKMTVRMRNDELVEFSSRIVREEMRETPLLLAESTRMTEEMMHCCGWCKKIQIPSGKHWVEVEEAVHELDLFAEMPMPRITHGACPDCVKNLVKMME
ncbi:MAG TPA: hypothetical protein VGH19_19075 [Verrucomicrobiae bacterium]